LNTWQLAKQPSRQTAFWPNSLLAKQASRATADPLATENQFTAENHFTAENPCATENQ
jgi:hypothetical protein